MNEKQLLIVTPHFAPSSAVGAKRANKLAYSVGKYGWQAHVLAAAVHCYVHTDPSPPLEKLLTTKVTRFPCWSLWQHSEKWQQSKPGLSRFGALANRLVAKMTNFVNPTDEWYPWSILATSRGIRIVREKDINLIWSTAPPLSSLYLAHRIWKRTGVPYIVDFRDVKAITKRKRSWGQRRKFKWERMCIENAAGITYTAPDQIKMLRDLYPGTMEIPSCLVYNWFEVSMEPNGLNKNKTLTILHGGNIYGSRRIDGLFNALASLKTGKGRLRRDFRFVHYGPSDGNNFLRKKVLEYGAARICYNQRYYF